MLKKLLRLFLCFCLLTDCFSLSAFGAEARPDSPDKAEEQSFENSVLKDPSRFGEGIKLFEPSRYGFLAEEKPLLLPYEETSPEEEDDYFRYNRAYLENVIKDMEGGIEIKERAAEYIEILNPSLLLPIYGTTISMTGRKTFGIKYDVKKYKESTSTLDDRNTSSMEFEQEMQLKVQGKISDRIFVDIDYDDQREDAQNIGVSYRGKPGEIVQSADFGDIELSLPGTEFISYSKQVFGAKMHLQYGDAHLRLIGSQNKGESKSKQFKGDSVFETVNIKDLQYIRRKYYDLTFGYQTGASASTQWAYAIRQGTERVYIDDHTNGGYQVAMKAVDIKTGAVYPSNGGTAAFRLLTRGVDYTVDYNQNILIFNNSLNATDVVAVDYENSQGAVPSSAQPDGYPILIKTNNDRPISSSDELDYQLEIKRYYNIGATQITRDDGSGNFILKLLESDGAEVCASSDTRPFCQFTVDYDKGIFKIGGRFSDVSLYNSTPVSSTNRYFFVQYTSTVKTYFLESDIVVQSETVKVNGATMARNKDYYVDYASGFITFYNSDLIGSNSVVDVTYEVSGGGEDTALMGGRFNYDFTDKISVGASLLNESGSEPKRVPNVGATASSLMAMEADFKVDDVEVAEGVHVSLGGEAAQSRKDENLFGYAMIDSMEETKEYIKASTVYSDWKIASNPTAETNFFDAVRWDSQDVPMLQINPSAIANGDDKQNVLLINYDFSIAQDKGYGDRDEVSIVFPISNSGVDFSDKTLFELTMQGEENGPLINVTFGTVNEMSDNYGDYSSLLAAGFQLDQIFPVCSKYYVAGMNTVPKTEDLRCTGKLTNSEDMGWLYINPDGSYQRYNPFANNVYNPLPQPTGKIETQDLNGNGLLDSEDLTSGGSFGFAGQEIQGLPGGEINFSGWKTFNQEVDFGSATNVWGTDWTSIQQMRVTLKRNPNGGKLKGQIRIASLGVSGSVWQPLDTDEEVLLSYGINNVDNTHYKPIFSDAGDGGEVFRTLYGSVNDLKKDDGTNNIEEQSLALQYDFSKNPALEKVSVQHNFSAMDFSKHRQFRFLLYNNGDIDEDTSFYLRIAADENNYSEVRVPLNFKDAWRLYSLKLIDTNGDNIPDRWENISKYDASVVNEGMLNYKRVGIITAGIIKADGTTPKGEVWLDDIFLADSMVTVGNAYMAQAKVSVDNWFDAGGKITYIDENFQTPVAVATNQKNRQEDYYLKFKRFKKFPINANYYRSNTITPDVLGYNSSNTVSLLDKGEVNRDRGSINAEYIDGKLPTVGVSYSFENADYQMLERKDDSDTYSLTLNHTAKSRDNIIKSFSAGTSLVKSKIDYSDAQLVSSSGGYYNSDTTTQNYNFKMTLSPWQGTSIVPSYSLTSADEKRKYFDASDGIESFKNKKYSKYASETASVSTALRLRPWLTPTASYSVSVKENNNLSRTSYKANDTTYTFDIGDVKSINRSSEGNVALSLNGRDMLPKSKLFSALTISGSYRLQDGDAWENVPDSFESLDKLWLRSSMGINSPYSYRSSLTMRDTYSAAMRWSPFKEYGFSGMAAPIKTISVINNFSRSYQTTEDLGSEYKTVTSTLPDVVFYIDELEKFFGSSGKVLSGANLKLKYAFSTNETLGTDYKEDVAYGGDLRFVLFNYFDTTLSYTEQRQDKTDLKVNEPLATYLRKDFSAQTSFSHRAFRFTPKITYIYDKSEEVGDVLVDRVEEIVPSLNVRVDFNLPFSFRLPLLGAQYLMTNRVIWNTTASYSRRRSFTVDENRDLIDITTSLDYEISKNVRLTLSGAFQDFKHLYIAEDSYTAYNIGTMLTIQF